MEATALLNTNLGAASLLEADLRRASMSGADLRDANLFGANLEDAEVADSELACARTLCATTLPYGLKLSPEPREYSKMEDDKYWMAKFRQISESRKQ